MKAIVIDTTPQIMGMKTLPPPFKEGETVTIEPCPQKGLEDFVIVVEYPIMFGKKVVYYKGRFAPISDIEDDILSEDQLEEIRERQLIKV